MENFDYQSILVDSGSIVQWGEGRLFGASAEFFFYENDRNSETRSQKIVPKVGNELSLRRLQTGLWQNLGSHGKNRTFGPKTELLGPKKRWVLNGHHDLATNGKSCAKKKFPFSQISISLFWPKKNTFRPEYISSSDAYKSKQRKKQQLDWVRYQGHITIPRSQSSRCPAGIWIISRVMTLA